MRWVLKDVQSMAPEAHNQSVINQLMAAVCLVWENLGDLLELITVLCEISVPQMMFVLQYPS